ncbi:type IV pilus modification protein PilV [Pseudothauera nasutitermitis]|uniref:Type IV pilus modification protein PilV n=1 Tax=Pseudothauera nasutitermitis TaxID=2565930 RepID=A0A4S4B4N9_9RHOO|nr:type IV pilus modification protein PilV [Pseudothauera nasutitermitis]THF65894.1 type IV pilus modification protein PilV [Pseudothauera nasutitermitis]
MSNRFSRARNAGQGEGGFSLLEVLIAVVVLSVGLLGMAALQINATKNNQSSYQRTQAVMLSYLMLDAMRANRAASYDTGNNMTCAVPGAGGDRRSRDLNIWFQSLKDQLGNVDSTCARIACVANNVCTIYIQWNDERAMAGGNAQTFSFTSRL